MNTIYICYQSLLEPLTQTQVVPYLEGLVQAGYRIVLLTFEPCPLAARQTRQWQRRLAAKGITWYWRRYHRRPTVPATAWDIMTGVFTGLRLMRRHKVCLVHARCHVPGLMALILKRLTGVRLLLDIRGFMAEEYVDAGIWPPDGMLFRLTKRVERALIGAADGIVVLTRRARELLFRWYPEESVGKPVVVIPCCVDLRDRPTRETPIAHGTGEVDQTMVYVGKLDGWYLTDAMAAFMATAIEMLPGLRWQVWTQSDPRRLRQLLAEKGVNGQVAVGRIPAEAVPAALTQASAGLSLIKPCLSKLAACPTKVGEYLAAGLPVIANPGIGDIDELLAGREAKGRPINDFPVWEGDSPIFPPGKLGQSPSYSSAAPNGRAPVGVVVREFTDQAYRNALLQLADLLADPGTPARCRAVAEEHLDLERVGWSRYRQVYGAVVKAATGN